MGYYIRVEKDVKIYVEDLNPEGRETIFFIHGWPANHKMFEYQFSELSYNGYRCIGVDTRGFGKSDKPVKGYSYDRLADDIRCIIEALKLQDITLAGHSTGGAIAIRYMARHHEYGVAKLALFAAAAPSLIQRPNFPYGLQREAVLKIVKETYQDRPSMLQGFGNMFFFQHVSQPFSDWFFQLGLEAAGWSTAAIAKQWLDETRLFDDLAEIHVPTLILHGIHDQVVHFQLGEIQNQGIKSSKLIPFRYSGHGLFYDEREKFNKELIDFMEEQNFCVN
ncbi:non-heme chloroperoxidase [Sporomusaceae bacterium BoRhaA]|uniref:alpha/beta fold hydrolase n=1 Tax=Pelorhabdus rhamnosifermentans TaxID=2772457 RepID=UPI001C063AC6|nr:alpha/beta hydrolase [Pelorhabdus rhamnosifermentans]MBU2702548.1 non-heme chloroperoxidase [Pelorhabdus rhamnosifermentans]